MSRSNAYITVVCDECGLDEEIELTKLAQGSSWDERNVAGELGAWGWIKVGEKDFCGDCVEAGREQ